MNEDEFAEFLDRDDPAAAAAPPPEGAAGAARVRALLGDEGVWAEPDPSGADDLLAAIRAERRERPPAGPPTPAPSRWAQDRRRGLAAMSAVAAVVLVAGVAVLVTGGGADDRGREYTVAGTSLAPEASAVATVEEVAAGVAIELDVRGLPPAEPGTYYQAWLKGPDGLVTVGTFHMQGGDDEVELWSGVPLDRYPTLTVTLQQEGGGPASSGQVVLSGQVGG